MESFSFKELLAAVVLVGSALGLGLGGWNAWIQTKLRSLGWVQKEFKAHVDKYNDDRVQNVEDYACKDEFHRHVKEYNEGRLSDAKEYASKRELKEVETRIAGELKTINATLHTLLSQS